MKGDHGLEGSEDPVEHGDVRAVLGDVDGVEAEQVLQGHYLVAGLQHASPEGKYRAAVGLAKLDSLYVDIDQKYLKGRTFTQRHFTGSFQYNFLSIFTCFIPFSP